MYADLLPEDKVLTAIGFVARGTEMPLSLAQFLRDEGLYELITQPQEEEDDGDA